ncbi:VWA domain-containing protein [Virgibacillus sp. JSM 102003]|uniref:vWA domain-containing protein n=1 Tax=Virgibacillus sp. JSM 102003 TaxID=1562108 RepID=UPI0035C00769
MIVLSVLFTIFITGCSEDSNKQEGKDESMEAGTVITPDEKSKENEKDNVEAKNNTSSPEQFDIEPLPTNVVELVALEQGEYAQEVFNNKDGAKLEGAALLDMLGEDVPEISSNPSEAELDYFYREVLKLVQDDYIGEEEILKDLKFQLLGSPELEDPRYQFKEQLNIEILLDASGSMAGEINGTTKMALAKEAITSFMEELPEQTNVALRVYGHKGTGADSDKELSCSSSEILYGFNPYKKDAFSNALDKVNPAGWTPNGLAISKAQEDLAEFNGKENTNIVYVVSDGIETCGTEPVKVAQDFYDSNIKPIINVIGFDVDNEGQNHLKEIAEAAKGIYQAARDHNELAKEFDKINELAEAWEEWKEKGSQQIDSKETQNSIDIFVYITRNVVKLREEQTSLKYIFKAFLSTDQISEKTYQGLIKRNKTYHDKMRDEMDKLEEELETWNKNSYKKALQKLENKYKENKVSN